MTRNTSAAATRRRQSAADRKAAKEAAAAAAVADAVNNPAAADEAPVAVKPYSGRGPIPAALRNAITEDVIEYGKSIAEAASTHGVKPEKVEAMVAAVREAQAPAEAKAAKAAKTGRFSREDDLMHDGKWSGVRVLGKREDGIDDLGVWGQGQDKHDVAVDAYEAANPGSKYASYITVQQRFLWVTAGAPAAVTA